MKDGVTAEMVEAHDRPIIVLTGVMAAGKSTVAELLAQRFARSVHLRGDIFRRMIVAGRAEMSAEPGPEALQQLDLRYRLTAQAARSYAEAGFQVIVQDNYLGEKLVFFLDLLQPNRTEVVVLCPSIEAVKQREQMRPKRGYVGFNVEELYAQFLAMTPRIGLWLDSSELTADETADRIIDELKGKGWIL